MRRSQKLAPGLVRLPVAPTRGGSGPAPGGLPVTLTREDDGSGPRVGLMAPTARPPWGCIFFSILGLAFIVAIFSRNWAVISGTVALIVFWALFNHPRRVSSEAARRAYSLLGMGKAERAAQALEPVLEEGPGAEGLNYVAALIEMSRNRPAPALVHLEEARPRMQVYAEFHHLQARCLRDLNREDEARRAYGRALDFEGYPMEELARQELEALDRPTPGIL